MIMVPDARQAIAERVVVAVDSGDAASDVVRILGERGIVCDSAATDALESADGVIALAPAETPSPARARELAPICRAAAEAGQPVVILASTPPGRGPAAERAAAALAYLRAAGAVIAADPDVWIETAILLACYGLPAGPRVAVVAPPGSLLLASAVALEREAQGSRLPPMASATDELAPTDVALVDRAVAGTAPERVGRALVVPVVARSELVGAGRGRPPLVGLRAALGAAAEAGRLAARLELGLGPAPADDADDLQPDVDRFDRQLDKLGERAGDHETKVLLSSWGVNVTRQAVATTASAAVRLAKRAGFPVEIKPWGPDIPSEAEGCPVERGLETAADVRRAYAAVARDAGLDAGAPTIVRETPPAGREIKVAIRRIAEVGPTLIADLPGVPHLIAAPAPISTADADELTAQLEATRAGDPEPDREALSDLLVRASHLVVARSSDIESLELGRVIVSARGQGAVVADARATLRHRK